MESYTDGEPVVVEHINLSKTKAIPFPDFRRGDESTTSTHKEYPPWAGLHREIRQRPHREAHARFIDETVNKRSWSIYGMEIQSTSRTDPSTYETMSSPQHTPRTKVCKSDCIGPGCTDPVLTGTRYM